MHGEIMSNDWFNIFLNLEFKKMNQEYLMINAKKTLSVNQAYDVWQADPTITTLRTTAKPISDIAFPAITICGQGSIGEVRNINNEV